MDGMDSEKRSTYDRPRQAGNADVPSSLDEREGLCGMLEAQHRSFLICFSIAAVFLYGSVRHI
jgi:hypothetical protein